MYGNPKGGFRPDDPNFRQPLPPPRISVYIGGGGGVEWDKVEIPKGITVIDRRAATAGVKPGQGAVIAGNVFDMSTGKPLSGAKILAFVPMNSGMAFRLAEGKMPIPEYEKAFADKSDDQGRFRVEKISAGSYRVSVSAPGYAALLASYAKIATDGYLGLDDVELAPAVSVTGTVTDEGEKPIAGATVRVDDILGMNGQSYRLPASAQATSDADGHFQITGLPQGYGRLFCFAKNYYAPLGEQRALPATDVVIRMIKTGAIKGKVAGDVQGRANNVSVEPEGQRIGKWGGGMQIGPDGTFRFDGVPPGTYYVTLGASYSLSDPAVQAKAKRITVVSGETVEVELTP